MAINDYKCIDCGHVEQDMLENPEICPVCDAKMEVFFGNWTGIEMDARHDERCDGKGFVKRFSCADDPLVMAQLGFGDSKLQSYNRMRPEQQKEYQDRFIKDGDSPKLRKEILKTYVKNTGKKVEVQED